MRIKPDVASVVGPSDDAHWGQAMLSRAAYGVVELSAPDAQRSGIELLTTLSERLENPPVSLHELTQLARDVMFEGVTTILLLVPVGSIVYVVLSGNGAVYLKRGNTLSCLLQKEGSLSGEVQKGDTILLASDSLCRSVSQETLLGVFDHLGSKDVAEKLTLVLHEGGGGLGSAALIFQVKEFVSTEEEQAVPVRPTEVVGKQPMETKWRMPKWRPPHWGKKPSLVLVLLLILFGASVLLGIAKNTQTKTSGNVERALVEATHLFEEGVALMELNPVKGRERLTQAKTTLEPFIASLSERSRDGKKVRELYSQVVDSLTTAQHSVRGEPVLFFDASLVKKAGSVDAMSLFEGKLGLLDKTNRSVYTLDIASKRSEIAGGGDAINGALYVSIYGDKIYVVTDHGVASVRLSDKKTTGDTITRPDAWGTIGIVAAYTGNVYLLDTEKSRIWKYVATEKGFSDLTEYLNPDTLPDLSKAISMAIDGSIWVSTSDGKILRFTQGKENTFLPQGIEPGLGNSLALYTGDVIKNIYVLDRDNKRVVVLDKDGFYLSQYLWDGSFVPTQLVVSESEKKILLLSEGKIFSLELK